MKIHEETALSTLHRLEGKGDLKISDLKPGTLYYGYTNGKRVDRKFMVLNGYLFNDSLKKENKSLGGKGRYLGCEYVPAEATFSVFRELKKEERPEIVSESKVKIPIRKTKKVGVLVK